MQKDMGKIMLYRLAGDPERHAKSMLFGPNKIKCQRKIFANAEEEIESAKRRGWIEAKTFVGMIESAELDAKSEAPDYPTDDRGALVQWIKDNDLASAIDLRKGLDDLVAAVEAELDAKSD